VNIHVYVRFFVNVVVVSSIARADCTYSKLIVGTLCICIVLYCISVADDAVFYCVLAGVKIQYLQMAQIFTDGSKLSNHTATALLQLSHIITKRFPNSFSVYTAELYAILLALSELSLQQRKHYLFF